VIGVVAQWIAALDPGRLRVAVDGLTGAGKTSFGHELAAALRRLGRPTMRASMDDFKHPWRHAREHGYDRTSGETAQPRASGKPPACTVIATTSRRRSTSQKSARKTLPTSSSTTGTSPARGSCTRAWR